MSSEVATLRRRLTALERSQRELKKTKEALQKRRDFERLIMMISTEFISLSFEQVDRSINSALQMIAVFIGADRGYVFLFSEDGATMKNTHEWCTKGTASHKERLKAISLADRFPWFAEIIKGRRVFYVPRLADLPEEAKAEKAEFEFEGIKSLIVVPMFCGGSLVGALGFDFVARHGIFPQEDVAMFRIAGEIFANAIVRTRAEEALRRTEERYHNMFENAVEGIYQTTPEGRFIAANPRLASMLGYGSVEELMSSITDIGRQAYVKPEKRKEYVRLLDEHGSIAGFEFQHYRKDHSVIWVSLNARVVRGDNGNPLYYEGMVIDVTERKRSEETIKRLAYHDTLTGLPNRALFHDRFTMALAQVQRHHKKMAVMSLDLDRFKEINDTFGHNFGDQVLRRVAKRLEGAIRRSDTVARLGGDEFIFLRPDIATEGDAAMVAQKILRTFQKPFAIGRRQIITSASIGVALYPSDGLNEEALTRHADVAMYRAKTDRNMFCLYVPQKPLVPETVFRDA